MSKNIKTKAQNLKKVLMKLCEQQNSLPGSSKNSYDDTVSMVDDFFDQWDPSTATPME